MAQAKAAFRKYMGYAEGVVCAPVLGAQSHTMGRSRVFVIPNPSPSNLATLPILSSSGASASKGYETR
jgi:hypothetical protein